MSIILANFGKYAISDCPFSFFVNGVFVTVVPICDSKHMHIWRLMSQKQVSMPGTSNYIQQYMWEIIVIPCPGYLEAVSIRKTVLPGMAIPMLKIRRPNGRLIFNMEIAIRR